MNGVHDLGGMHGFGPVEIERNEPVFHSAWEARVYALQTASGYLGRWNIDMSRYARERMPPAAYLAASYYEKWLYGLETLLLEQGLITANELATGRAEARAEGARLLRASDVPAFIGRSRSGHQQVDVPGRFKAGDLVVTRNINPLGHTRLPRYARAKRGEVVRDHGVYIFPDTHAITREKKPQHCYSVGFTSRELWGPAAYERDSVYLDLWDDYLDPA